MNWIDNEMPTKVSDSLIIEIPLVINITMHIEAKTSELAIDYFDNIILTRKVFRLL